MSTHEKFSKILEILYRVFRLWFLPIGRTEVVLVSIFAPSVGAIGWCGVFYGVVVKIDGEGSALVWWQSFEFSLCFLVFQER